MNSKERFSDRVDMYVKYRPSYPKEAINYLYDTVGMNSKCEVADIGAGTGIFSAVLLERGSKVTAVEPNMEMRGAADKQLGGEQNFRILPGSAEETGLPDQSVDFIVCAQAFHWFDHSAAQLEFRRILTDGGKVVLIWNSRLIQGTPFLEEYDQLLHTFGTDYNKVNHQNISRDTLHSFFKTRTMQTANFHNQQTFDYKGLAGRLQSSSYSPASGHPNYKPMMKELRELFERNKQDGKVSFEYETEVFWGEV